MFEQRYGSSDAVGYVFAINGRISTADVYPSNALFGKMWSKQLNAGITEAIGNAKQADAAATAPTPVAVANFLKTAEVGEAELQPLAAGMAQETRDGDRSLYIEVKRSDGRWVHRNYLAK